MKLKHYFSGALLVGLMASCSNDLPVQPEQILEKESTTYIRLSLVGQGGATRADDYTSGDEAESNVKDILLTFFDAGRNYVGDSYVEVKYNIVDADDKVIEEGNVVDDDKNGNPDITVERILTVVAEVNLPKNINYPKYVVAYVNPTSEYKDLQTDKLEDAMTFIRQRETISHDGYRTMNNSVYFDSTTGYTRYATEVDFDTHFFSSFADAKAAPESKVITITVERMEAKVQLNALPPANKIEDITAGDYALKFVPEYWFVNATEKRSFLLKNYRTARKNYIYDENKSDNNMPAADIADFGYRLSALNLVFTNAGQSLAANPINKFEYKRSFWAIDPTYFYEGQNNGIDYYPDISLDVQYGNVNTTGGKYYPLEYRSYDDVKKEYAAKGDKKYRIFDDAGVKTHEYVLENTMSNNTLHDTDAKAAMTSVVMLGYYQITKGNEVVFDGSRESFTAGQDAFYIRHEASGSMTVMTNDKEAIDFFMERSGSTFFVKTRSKNGKPVKPVVGTDGKVTYEEIEEDNETDCIFEPLRAAHLDPTSEGNENNIDYKVSHADFELRYPSSTYTQGKKLSEQWRTLRVKKISGNYNSNIYVYDAANNSYKKLNNLSEKELDEFYKKEYSTFGVIERFENGRAYFNIPLKHIWANLSETSNEFKPKDVKIGDYGVVRNHVYDLTINGITKGVGTGIGDLKQPIVVPTENEQYFISTRLNILQWRVVKQNVDL